MLKNRPNAKFLFFVTRLLISLSSLTILLSAAAVAADSELMVDESAPAASGPLPQSEQDPTSLVTCCEGTTCIFKVTSEVCDLFITSRWDAAGDADQTASPADLGWVPPSGSSLSLADGLDTRALVDRPEQSRVNVVQCSSYHFNRGEDGVLVGAWHLCEVSVKAHGTWPLRANFVWLRGVTSVDHSLRLPQPGAELSILPSNSLAHDLDIIYIALPASDTKIGTSTGIEAAE